MVLDQTKVEKILYGGDYNPEQWDSEIWQRDMEMFDTVGIDIVTLNVFNWAMLQPNEESYDFSALDKTVKRVTEHDVYICMATSTAAHPAWMARKYPDILRTEFNGMERKFGGRHNSCPNSPTFQKYSGRLAEKLAEYYKEHENIIVWHVGNEYGGACYCENCEKAFRVWLRKKYQTLDKLNHAWNTNFWGHTFYDWDEIVAPNLLSEHFEEDRSMFPGITLDYKRFNSDSMLKNFRDEYNAIKKHIPDAIITTNFMGFYKPLNYKKWAKYMDIVSWDNYPEKGADPALVAMNHELMKGLKNGQPFMLMEQTPSVSNWLPDNSLKRPGVMRLQSYQAVAHGADTVMFFQMRRSPGACEKFHGAVIDHVGRDDTRVFRECVELGKELKNLGSETLATVSKARVAILFDWENWWAVEASAGPSTRLKYVDEVFCYYQALFDWNVTVDIIGVDDDYSRYQLIIAPLLYMVKPKVDEKLKSFVNNGGNIIFTYFSGYVNENDYITPGGYPGKLRNMIGIWVEETDALSEKESNSFLYNGENYPAGLLCDIIQTEGAEVLASYQQDFYKDTPVITKNSYGKGDVYYVGTRSNEVFYKEFIKDVCVENGVPTVLYEDEGVLKSGAYEETGLEITRREKSGSKYTFILNHGRQEKRVEIPFEAVDLLTGIRHHKDASICCKPKEILILKNA